MPRNNAENQRRFRERNVVLLTARAEEIAEKLMDMEDQKKLQKVYRLIGNHLKNPNRSSLEKAVDLAAIRMGLGKKATLERVKQYQADQLELERAYVAGEVSQEEFNKKHDATWRYWSGADEEASKKATKR
jgi:hypothetical protein